MDATFFVIIFTFIVGIFGIIKETPVTERKGIFKKLNIPNFLFLLITILLAIQIYDHYINRSEKETKNALDNNTYDGVKTTIDKVHDANKSIKLILNDLQTEINYTQKEFSEILLINRELNDVRKHVSESLKEYNKLNDSYNQQLKIEREKIINSKPDVRIMYTCTKKDTIGLKYQFQLINYGNRIADSVQFYSIMLLPDSTGKSPKITELKTNINQNYILSIPSDESFSYFANSIIYNNDESITLNSGYLLVKRKYFDVMLNKFIFHDVEIYHCDDLTKTDKQFAINIPNDTVIMIRKFILKNQPDLYKIFFEN